MTIQSFRDKKAKNQKIVMVTCYESWAASIVESTPVDCILVGDSINMVMYGQSSTLSADMDLMTRHTRAVAPFAPSKLVIGDMPFLSYRQDLKTNVLNAGSLMQAGAHAVKLEGAAGNLDLIRHLVDSGIPVMGHLGLTPQSVNTLSGYKVQGRKSEDAEKIKNEALALEKAGCFGVVLECVPSPLASEITRSLKIPTIGIGAGLDTDGQVLVWHDLLGMQNQINPKFVRKYLDGRTLIANALNQYAQDVAGKSFPSVHESFES